MLGEAITRRSFVAKSAAVAAVAGVSLVGGAAVAAAAEEEPMPKPVILVVSFGTSFNDSRHITIGAIESAVRERYPEYDVRRAFTSQIIIDKLAKRDGIAIDNIPQALDRVVADGVKTLVVQPTHLMAGFEYSDLAEELAAYADRIDNIVLGSPLLDTDEDYEAVIAAITGATSAYDDGQTAICFMGHGTEAESNSTYAKLQEMLRADGYDQYFVGTVEATPTFDDVVEAASAAGFKKALLHPLMVVAGDHANNDMADPDDPESFVSKFMAAGFEVECVIEGLGQLVAIDEIYVSHVADSIALL